MLLFTLIFLLADGAPCAKCYVACEGIATFEAGNDVETPGSGVLIIDSRGAAIVGAHEGDAVTCYAEKHRQSWQGRIVFTNTERIIRRSLKELKR